MLRPLLLAVILTASALPEKDLPRSSTDLGAFAFPDPTGKLLIATSEPGDPEKLTTAVCGGHRRFSVEFVRAQAEREGGMLRDIPDNFEYLAGSIFRVRDGTVDPEETCFLASQSLASSSAFLPLSALSPAVPCPDLTVRRITEVRKRAVSHCWETARARSGPRLLAVEFVRNGRNALASIVLLERSRFHFADYPAEVEDEGSVWRVEDEGVFSPDGHAPVFLVSRRGRFIVASKWSAAEGTSLEVRVSTGDGQLVPVLSDYWYRAPR